MEMGLDREKGSTLTYIRDGIHKPILLICLIPGQKRLADQAPPLKLTPAQMGGRTAAGQQIVASYHLSNHVGRGLAGQQVKTHRCSQRMCWRLSIRLAMETHRPRT